MREHVAAGNIQENRNASSYHTVAGAQPRNVHPAFRAVKADGGYVRLYRRVWDNPAFRNEREAAAFIWMVSQAQWKETIHTTRFGPVKLGAGELLIAERDLSARFAIDRTALRRLLFRLSEVNLICTYPDRAPHRSGTVLEVLNYRQYQGVAASSEGEENHKRTASEPQTTLSRPKNKEGKEGKEEHLASLSDRPGSGRVVAAPVPDLLGDVHAPTARQTLWRDGPLIVAQLTGYPDKKARSLLGKMVSRAEEDCIRVVQVLHQAQTMHPIPDPEAYLLAAAAGRRGGAKATVRHGDASWMLDPGAHLTSRAPAASPDVVEPMESWS